MTSDESVFELADPLRVRGVTFPNRAWISPMCQYSAAEGRPDDWHFVHYGSLASGKPGLIIAESTAVSDVGRISSLCCGLYSDEQEREWARIVNFCHKQGVPVGIQLSHAGRKASTKPPWDGEGDLLPEEGGWRTVSPSAIAYDGCRAPHALTESEIINIVEDFAHSAERALRAGFDVIELHAAHGYLMHQFLSPLSNQRTDSYGGSLLNRMRFPIRVAERVRHVIGEDMPLFVRLSATDWVSGGWDVDASIAFAKALGLVGVDVIDVSSGGLISDAQIPRDADYQVKLSAAIRSETGLTTTAVGRITQPRQANSIISRGQADAVFVARSALVNPHWPLVSIENLGSRAAWPLQYERARDVAKNT